MRIVARTAWTLLAALPLLWQSPTQAQQILRTRQPVPGQYIVVLKDEAAGARGVLSKSDQVAADLRAAYGGRVKQVYRHAVNGFAIQMPQVDALALSADPRVAWVEEDGWVRINDTQNSPPYGLDRIDQRDRPLSGTYTYSATGAGVNAYVIDTGIRDTHQEFGGRATRNFDAFGGTGVDGNGHGTHVAGTIGGTTYGVAKNVRLFGVRVLDNSGNGSWSGVIAGVDWVTANHVKPAVANMSLGGGAISSVDAAVRNSIAAGVTYVLAAGNNGADARNYSPARVTEAITVGSVDINDTRASTSNYGPILDLFAPGVNVRSSWYTSNTATANLSGTSMASPHVAGVVAQYLQNNPLATPAAASAALVGNASIDKVINPGVGSVNRLLYAVFADAATLPVYRLDVGEYYFLTTSQAERDGLTSGGWTLRGVAGNLYATEAPGTTALFRLYYPQNGDHFYTASAAERDSAVAGGYVEEGILGYVYTAAAADRKPLLRAYNPSTGQHRFTGDQAEYDALSADWDREGIAAFLLL